MKQSQPSANAVKKNKKQKSAQSSGKNNNKPVQLAPLFASPDIDSDSDDNSLDSQPSFKNTSAFRALDRDFERLQHANEHAQRQNKRDQAVVQLESGESVSSPQDDDDSDPDEIPLPVVDPTTSFNPLLDVFNLWTKAAPADMDQIFDPDLNETRRQLLMDHLPISSQNKYAWAIPTTKCIELMFHFGPIVEIGAGKGYWGYLLRKYAQQKFDQGKQHKYPQLATLKQANDVYIGYDCSPTPTKDENAAQLNAKQASEAKRRFKKFGDEPMKYITDAKNPAWTHINIGGAEALAKHPNHTLFLCYPDGFEFSDESLSFNCLEQFQGEYIITVGEWLGETLQENPFGRSADGEFQQYLCDQFHKILHLSIPSWPTSSDHFCVWKRTQKIALGDDEMVFRHIPAQERLSIVAAAPFIRHLLDDDDGDEDNDVEVKENDNVDVTVNTDTKNNKRDLPAPVVPQKELPKSLPKQIVKKPSKIVPPTPQAVVQQKTTSEQVPSKILPKKHVKNALLKQAVAQAKASQGSAPTPVKRKK